LPRFSAGRSGSEFEAEDLLESLPEVGLESGGLCNVGLSGSGAEVEPAVESEVEPELALPASSFDDFLCSVGRSGSGAEA
jgi:hypothetical protein